MKIIAINASPRKKWNTATLLEKALEGAASRGAQTELVHLYDLNFKGCISCFACRTRGSKSYGRCAVKDDLAPLFQRMEAADAVVLGSPIYLGTVTGEMRSFFERWIFQYLPYTDPFHSLFPGTLKTAFIYTMNMTEEGLEKLGMLQTYENHYALNRTYMERIFGHSCYQLCMDTLQFDDYSKVVADRWDPEAKARSRAERFPVDCQKAFMLGVDLMEK